MPNAIFRAPSSSGVKATTPTVIFFALEPDECLDAFIRSCKAKVREIAGVQTYLDHPPHLTLYASVFDDDVPVIDTARQLAAELSALQTPLEGWRVFMNDALTGGNTLACEIASAQWDVLIQFQRQVIQAMSGQRLGDHSAERYLTHGDVFSDDQRRCIGQFGFPFVGEGWIPHITIASIAQKRWPAVYEMLVGAPPGLVGSCRRLGVYRLYNETPEKLASFPLA